MGKLSVDLSGWELENPIIPASGCFGYGREFAELYDINVLGTFSCKGTTIEPRVGNPAPRIAECAAGMLNAVGLQNPGVDHVLEHELPELATYYHKKIIANVSGFSLKDYVSACEKLGRSEQVGLLEINVSCPNVRHGGMSFGTTPESVAAVTRAVKNVTDKPVYIKLTPNVTDIAVLAKACEEAGADGVCLINTLLGMRIDLKERRPLLGNRTGGYSGPGVFPVAMRMVYDVYEAVNIPIIGMGGVRTVEDVLEMLLAGASAVEVGAANLVDPFVCERLVAELPNALRRYHFRNVRSVVGRAHPAIRPRDRASVKTKEEDA